VARSLHAASYARVMGWRDRLNLARHRDESDEGPLDASAAEAAGELEADKPRLRGSDDLLGRLPFAERIASLIAARNAAESLVIAIYGPWGDGKTSVVNFVEDCLKDSATVIFIKFNPWIVDDRNALLRSFFETIATTLGEKLATRGQELAGALRKYSGYLAPLAGPAAGPMNALERTSAAVSTRKIEDDKRRISRLLAHANKRVVVAIDDIDRLERSEIAELLKLVRLVADFERTVYLLAFDRRVVADALSERYPGGEDQGTSFLEKIVQVPLLLPPPEGDSLEQLTLETLQNVLASAGVTLNDEENSELGLRFRDGISAGIGTPRAAIQFANAVAFALPMLKGEANTVDVISIEALRSAYPKVHEFVRDNADLVLGLSVGERSPSQQDIARAKEAWSSLIAPLSADRRRSARSLAVAIFPRLAAGLGENNHFGNDWSKRWGAEKRAASPDHFERYFTYHVAKDQVSEVALDALVGQLAGISAEAARAMVAVPLRSGQSSSLIRYLRQRERELSPDAAKALAIALAQLGDILDRPLVMFSFSTAFEQTAILISRLIERLPVPERSALALDIVATARPLPFAAHILRWIRARADATEAERILAPAGEQRAIEEVVARIANEAVLGSPLYERYALDAPLLLSIWSRYGEPGACRAYVARTLVENPGNAVRLLRTYLPTAFSIGSGKMQPSDFERDQFQALELAVDPGAVYSALQATFPDLTSPDEFPRGFDDFTDRRVAEQFSYLYSHPDAAEGDGEGSRPRDDGPGSIVVTPDQDP
jgi:hypothetical protein